MIACTSVPGGRSDTDRKLDDYGGPVLRAVDSITLEESDTAFLGRVPYTFTVGDGGLVYVVDQAADRLLVFSPEGHLRNIVGRHGSGPGEVDRIEPITIPYGDAVLQGWGGSTLTLFDTRRSAELFRLRHRGYFASWASLPNHLVLGTYLGPGQAAVTKLPLDSMMAGQITDWLQPSLGVTPLWYRDYPGLELFNQVVVGAVGDSLLVGFGPSEDLLLVDGNGSTIDSWRVPRRFRRGASASQFPRYSNPGQTFHEGLSGISNLLAIWLMSGRRVALWFQDATTEDPARPNADIQGVAYISVLDPALGRACVDGAVTAPGTGRTRLAFSRDTLYSLDQVVEDDADRERVRTVVRRYTFELSGCRWLSAAGGTR